MCSLAPINENIVGDFLDRGKTPPIPLPRIDTDSQSDISSKFSIMLLFECVNMFFVSLFECVDAHMYIFVSLEETSLVNCWEESAGSF